jgi:hypothetical protein
MLVFFFLFFVGSVCFVRVRPITGTFLDVQYDSRLKNADPAAFNFSCADWESKMRDWVAFGIDLVIFQAVLDERWGCLLRERNSPRLGRKVRRCGRHSAPLWRAQRWSTDSRAEARAAANDAVAIRTSQTIVAQCAMLRKETFRV